MEYVFDRCFFSFPHSHSITFFSFVPFIMVRDEFETAADRSSSLISSSFDSLSTDSSRDRDQEESQASSWAGEGEGAGGGSNLFATAGGSSFPTVAAAAAAAAAGAPYPRVTAPGAASGPGGPRRAPFQVLEEVNGDNAADVGKAPHQTPSPSPSSGAGKQQRARPHLRVRGKYPATLAVSLGFVMIAMFGIIWPAWGAVILQTGHPDFENEGSEGEKEVNYGYGLGRSLSLFIMTFQNIVQVGVAPVFSRLSVIFGWKLRFVRSLAPLCCVTFALIGVASLSSSVYLSSRPTCCGPS
jgi:hypothetical protein